MTSLLNFKARFVPLILDGSKQQTIRAERKRPIKEGERLRMQHGSRFQPKLMGWATALLVEAASIDVEGGQIVLGQDREVRSKAAQLDEFAVWDGFTDWADMRGFWRKEHPTLPMFRGFRTFWGNTLEPVPHD